MSSPSALIKVNYLAMRYLHFGSVRGDLQEGHGCASRCQFLLFLCRSPFFPSTKSGFLCFFGLRNPRFRAFRAQNRGFCALLPFKTHIFGRFEHKIGIFVRGVLPLRSAAKQLPSRWSRCGTNGSGCPVRLKWLPFGLSAPPYQHSVSFSISGMSEAWYSGSFPALS